MILNAQGCAECGKGSGYALFCVACHDEFRVWVGLTDEELKPLCDEWRIIFGAHVNMFAREIESQLKEKNCA